MSDRLAHPHIAAGGRLDRLQLSLAGDPGLYPFDPVADARILSLSAQQNFYAVYADFTAKAAAGRKLPL